MKRASPATDKRDAAGGEVCKVVFSVFGILFALYVIASFFPDSFLWGINHLAFVDDWIKYVLIVLALVLGMPQFSTRYIHKLESILSAYRPDSKKGLAVVVILGAVASVVFFQFRIATDMYGDTRTLLESLANRGYTPGDVIRVPFAEFDFREPLTRYIHQMASQASGLDQRLAIEIFSAVCGGIFILIFARFILKSEGTTTWKLLALVIGLTAGVNQLFFGHVESYTIPYLALVVVLILGWSVFDGKKTVIPMAIIVILGTRLHTQFILLLPATIYAVFYHYSPRVQISERLLKTRTIILGVLSTLMLALFCYLFVFEAYQLGTGDSNERGDKIFLPVVNPLPEPHDYSLLAPAHLSDFIQELFFTISPGVWLFVAVVIVLRGKIPWESPRVIFFGLSAFYFLLFNATVNPLLSMPRDWDFLSLAAAPITFLALAVGDYLNKVGEWVRTQRNAVGCVIGLSVLSCSIFGINASEQAAAELLRGVDVWVYNSYYQGSAYILNVSAKMVPGLHRQIEDRKETIRKLESSKSSPDHELAFLYHKLADALFEARRDDEAVMYYRRAVEEDSLNASAVKRLAKLAMLGQDLEKADSIIDPYNESINGVEILDFGGLTLGESINHVRYVMSTQKDPDQLQRLLDSLRFTDY